MKWIEWNPIPIRENSIDSLPTSYSIGLTKLTLVILLPMGVLGFLARDWPIAFQLLPLTIPLVFRKAHIFVGLIGIMYLLNLF